MENKLVLFDNAERTRELISNFYLTGNRAIIVPENFKELEKILSEGYKPLVTEFSSVNLLSGEIELFLKYLVKNKTPTIIYTNNPLYKNHLEQLKEANIYAIIRKMPKNETKLKNNIEYLLSGKKSDGIKILDTDGPKKPSLGRVMDHNIRDGYHPFYSQIRISSKEI